MSTGSASTTSTAAKSMPAARRSASVSSMDATPCGLQRRLDDGDDDLPTGWADADHGSLVHGVQSLDALLRADRGHRTGSGGDDVSRPSLHPEPAVLVEVPKIAGAVPAVVARALALGGPELVVVVLDVRAAHTDLTGDVGGVGQRSGCRSGGVQRTDRHLDTRYRMADEHAIAASADVELGERDVGDR